MSCLSRRRSSSRPLQVGGVGAGRGGGFRNPGAEGPETPVPHLARTPPGHRWGPSHLPPPTSLSLVPPTFVGRLARTASRILSELSDRWSQTRAAAAAVRESPGEVPPGACAAPGDLPGPPPPRPKAPFDGGTAPLCTAQGLSPCARRSFFLRSCGPEGKEGGTAATHGPHELRSPPPHRPDFSSSPSALHLRRQLLQLERNEVFGDAQDVVGHLGHAARYLHVPVPLYRSCRHPRRTPFAAKPDPLVRFEGTRRSRWRPPRARRAAGLRCGRADDGGRAGVLGEDGGVSQDSGIRGARGARSRSSWGTSTSSSSTAWRSSTRTSASAPPPRSDTNKMEQRFQLAAAGTGRGCGRRRRRRCYPA